MSTLEKKKILLAEDDDSMRRFIEIILKKAGYEILTAEDGLAAMPMAFENDIDAVVADAIMPNLSGYDLCRMIRGNAEKKQVPLIILSGMTKEFSNESKNIADIFLVKDTNLKENLISALQKLL